VSVLGESLIRFLHNIGDVLRGMGGRRAPC